MLVLFMILWVSKLLLLGFLLSSLMLLSKCMGLLLQSFQYSKDIRVGRGTSLPRLFGWHDSEIKRFNKTVVNITFFSS